MDDPGERDFGSTTALCSVRAFEAGATYTLATPLTLEATERAYYDTFLYRIQEDSAAQRAAQRAGAAFERAPAACSKAVPAKKGPAARSADSIRTTTSRTSTSVRRTRPTSSRTATTWPGPQGSFVKADIGFRNEGPA